MPDIREHERRLVQMKLVERDEDRKHHIKIKKIQHKDTMEELKFMADNNIQHFNRYTNLRKDKGQCQKCGCGNVEVQTWVQKGTERIGFKGTAKCTNCNDMVRVKIVYNE